MNRVIVVHGFKGKPDTNWKPWLAKELEDNGFTVNVPEMPETDHPKMESWVQKLKETVGTPGTDTIFLVGHSLGCITILKYLEALNGERGIKASVFIAGFTRPFKGYEHGHDSFFETDIDWRAIKNSCEEFVALHSVDDPNVPIEELKEFENKLGAETKTLDGYGHFGSADGIFEVPIVRDIILELAK